MPLGISTLIMNLLTSFADDVENTDNVIKSEIENVDDDETGTWVGEYQRGCDWEIYSTPLAEMFEGVQFGALSDVLYQKLGSLPLSRLLTQLLTPLLSGIVLFALQIEDVAKDKGNCRVFLNPSQFEIPEKGGDLDIVAFVLAKNKAQSDLTFSSGVDSHGFMTSINQISFSASSYASKLLGHNPTKIECNNSELNLDVPVKVAHSRTLIHSFIHSLTYSLTNSQG